MRWFSGSIKKQVILFLCGSFNPITLSHLQMFEIAKDYLEKLKFEVVGGVVSPVHHRLSEDGLELQNHRIEMIKIALKASDWIQISEWETKQEDWTKPGKVLDVHLYKLRKLSELKVQQKFRVLPSWIPENLPNLKNIQIMLLCGDDFFESFSRPDIWNKNDIRAILKHGIVIITQNSSEITKFISKFDILKKNRKNIFVVSSRDVDDNDEALARYYISQEASVKDFVDGNVMKYIKRHGLYKEGI